MTERNFAKPLFFEKNRVFRVYTGGALFADFFGDDSTDGNFPEEWVASSVEALNREKHGEREGVSVTTDGDYFDKLIKAYPAEMLGEGRTEFGVLTKLLDSAIRLPAQAHPDKAFSRKVFHSEYGKAESWLVIATRENAKLYFGFKKPVTKAEFAAAVERAKTDKNALVPYLNELAVKPGDVYFVPARMAHAIGEGCLILEVQEPTDFTIQPDHWCGDYELNDREMYIGLDHDLALDVFDYTVYGEEAVKRGRREPKIIGKGDGYKRESLISYDDTPCFAVERVTLAKQTVTLNDAPAVYVVTNGAGKLTWDNGSAPIRKGSYFFLPYAAGNRVHLETAEEITFAVCLPPIK